MTAHRTTTRGRAGAGASERPVHADSGAGAVLEPCGADSGPESGAWRLWFPQRYAPPRKRTVTVAGQRVEIKTRALEFPPGPNGSRGNPFAHNAWVQEWRKAAKEQAQARRIPSCERVLISAVYHRTRLGQADEDNDRARLKPLVDGLRDAGVIRRDTRKHVTYGACAEVKAKPGECGILLIVEALAPVAESADQQ